MNQHRHAIPTVYCFDEYLLDSGEETLTYKGETVSLNQKSFECLLLLVRNHGRIVTKEEFIEDVWQNSYVEDGILAVNISNLRKTLGDAKTKSKYIQTVPRKGYRFIAEVTSPAETNIGIHLKEETAPPEEKAAGFAKKEIDQLPKNGQARNKGLKKALYFGLITIVVFLVGGLFYNSNRGKKEKTVVPVKKVSIFPFQNINQTQEINYLSLAFLDALNNSLYALPHLTVSSTSQMKQFLNQSYDPINEGKKMGADAVVTGTYYQEEDKLVVEVVVIDLGFAKPVPQKMRFIRTTNDLSELKWFIARFIVSSLNLYFSEKELLELKKRETLNPQAYEYFLRASNAQANGNLTEAAYFYEESIKLDPEFSLAFEGLAAIYMAEGNSRGCGIACARKGIEVLQTLKQKDPKNYRVIINLAQFMIELNESEEAIPILEDLLKEDLVNDLAYNTLSYGYRYVGCLEKSNQMFENSRKDIYRSGLNLKGEGFYNNALLYRGDYGSFVKSLEDEGDTLVINFYKGFGYFYMGDNSNAKKYFEEAFQSDPEATISQIGKVYVYYLNNDKEQARKLLESIYESVIKNTMYDGEIIYKVAQAFAVLGQKDKALELFDLSIEKGFFAYPYFASDPLLKNIRNESLFRASLEKAKVRHERFKPKCQ